MKEARAERQLEQMAHAWDMMTDVSAFPMKKGAHLSERPQLV